MRAGREWLRGLRLRTGGHALHAADPAAKVRAFLNPGLEQGDLCLRQIFTLGRHVAVFILRQRDRLIDAALVGSAGGDHGAVFAAFEDGPGGIEPQLGLRLLLLPVFHERRFVAVNALLGDDWQEVFFKVHRRMR